MLTVIIYPSAASVAMHFNKLAGLPFFLDDAFFKVNSDVLEFSCY